MKTKLAMMAIVLGISAFGNVNFKCDVDTQGLKTTYTSRPEEKYSIVESDFLLGGEKYNLYVYYDGKSSAINVVSVPNHENILGSDSEVEEGKYFSLYAEGKALPPEAKFLSVSCKSE